MPAELDRCVKRITPALKQQYPEKTEKEITSMAWATCTKLYKDNKLCRDGTELKLGLKGVKSW